VKIAVQLQPTDGAQAEVKYRWDPDTDILSAQVAHSVGRNGMSGSVGLEGADGSWVILDVADGNISGVEVAVWPNVQQVSALAPPAQIEDARVVVPARKSQPDIASLEMKARLFAEADHAQRNFHFRLGKPKPARTVRIAKDLLLDVDERSQISGLWLLNVPPCPNPS